jgi:hypothetical protein
MGKKKNNINDRKINTSIKNVYIHKINNLMKMNIINNNKTNNKHLLYLYE